ncbi:MAG: NifB/NifX family molybdenum-iron cluster-binding protein [Candidatus Eiseniibacteriota bacterium]|jgi:predicted Fe-Mo cluster-binding NifX family protein
MNQAPVLRIAVACESHDGLDSPLCAHFGHSPAFAIVRTQGDTVLDCEVAANPFGARHQPHSIPDFIADLGVGVVITGGMGQRAIARFQQCGVDVATCAGGTVRSAVESHLAGRTTEPGPCVEHHGHGAHDGCGH